MDEGGHAVLLTVTAPPGLALSGVRAEVQALGQPWAAPLSADPAQSQVFTGSLSLPQPPRYLRVRLTCALEDGAEVACGDSLRFTDDLHQTALAWQLETGSGLLQSVLVDPGGASLVLQLAWGLARAAGGAGAPALTDAA